VETRLATEDDLDVLRRLWDASVAEATYTPYPAAPFEPAFLTEHLAVVADDAGEVVGAAYANLSSPDFGYVFGLYTVPEARRRGVASALMRRIAAELRELGRDYVVLNVDTPNEAARALYERLGFEDAARMLRAEVRRLTD
jgi:aminoglycoside 6'-N-acetyltransferase I